MRSITLKAARKAVVLAVHCAAIALSASAHAAGVDYNAVETLNSWAVNAVHGDWAYANGYRGAGVAVANLDTGLNTANREFAGKLLPGYNFYSGTGAITELATHGTETAGLIVAPHDGSTVQTMSDMYGMAQDAKLLPVIVGNAATIPFSALANGINYAASYSSAANVRVLNLSIGWTSPVGDSGVQAAMKNAVNSGKLLVFAAGNDGSANPMYGARYANQTWSNGQILAVGAVDRFNNIASYSNRAGDTMYNYLVAPGSLVTSTAGTGYAAGLMGTSFAAPTVSGAAALLMGNWPKLTAAQTASILLVTATDLGAKGVDPIYGYGLLNVQAALQPVAYTNVQTKAGVVSTAHLGTLTVSPAVGSSVAAIKAVNVVALDSYGRDFNVNLSGAVRATSNPMTVDMIFSAMDSRMRMVDGGVGGTRLVAAMSDPVTAVQRLGLSDHQVEAMSNRRMGSMFVSCNFASGRLSFGSGAMGDRFFGIGESIPSDSFSATGALANPFLGLVKGYSHVGFAAPVTGGLELKVGLINSSNVASAFGFNESLGYSSGAMPRNSAMLGELSYRTGDYHVSASFGNVSERNSMLGTVGSGSGTAFDMPTTATRFVSLAGAYKLSSRAWLASMTSIGVTSGFSGGSGVIDSVSPIATTSWSVGLIGKDVYRKEDRLRFAITQPMRALGGTMNVATLQRINDQGDLAWTTSSIPMKPTGAERDLELNYSAPTGKTGSLSFVAARRYQPGNDAGAPTDNVIGVRWSAKF